MAEQHSEGEHVATAMVHVLPARVMCAWPVTDCAHMSKVTGAVRLLRSLGRRGQEARATGLLVE
jgi:hypothetical protein